MSNKFVDRIKIGRLSDLSLRVLPEQGAVLSPSAPQRQPNPLSLLFSWEHELYAVWRVS